MIVRIVKLTFQEGKAEEFIGIFQKTKKKIRHFRGNIFLELLRDKKDTNVFMTYSVWSTEHDLERYRESELFQETWATIKVMFAKNAEVMTMDRIEKS